MSKFVRVKKSVDDVWLGTIGVQPSGQRFMELEESGGCYSVVSHKDAVEEVTLTIRIVSASVCRTSVNLFPCSRAVKRVGSPELDTRLCLQTSTSLQPWLLFCDSTHG
jgi:hypothetical protein